MPERVDPQQATARAQDPIDLRREEQHVHQDEEISCVVAKGQHRGIGLHLRSEVRLMVQHRHRQIESDDIIEPLDEMPGAEAGDRAELDHLVACEPATIERAEDRGLTLRGRSTRPLGGHAV